MIVLALHQLSVVITRRSELKQEVANRGPNSRFVLEAIIKDLIYANLAILATPCTCSWSSGGKSWTLRWLRSLLDKLDISC